MPDPRPKYEYTCSKGHYIAASQPVVSCVVARCQGELKRIGRGSRKEAAK